MHGYYVLPFLCDGAIAARVDLKADRQAGCLLVQSAHREPGAPGNVAERLATELALMASWLGLQEVSIAGQGDLAEALRSVVYSGEGNSRLLKKTVSPPKRVSSSGT